MPTYHSTTAIEDWIDVESKSNPGKVWTVKKINGVWVCDCIAGTMKGYCRHTYEAFRQVDGIDAQCVICGSRNVDLAHLRSRAQDPARKYDTTNVRYLCRKHHEEEERNPKVRALRQRYKI